MNPKKCLECNEKIIGREDKKFCGDGCRNAFNYKNNRVQSNLVRNINNRLQRNYKILCEINRNGKVKTTREQLNVKGFDFNLMTNIRQTTKGNTYIFLYDQGYTEIEKERYLVIKKQL